MNTSFNDSSSIASISAWENYSNSNMNTSFNDSSSIASISSWENYSNSNMNTTPPATTPRKARLQRTTSDEANIAEAEAEETLREAEAELTALAAELTAATAIATLNVLFNIKCRITSSSSRKIKRSRSRSKRCNVAPFASVK
jgi:hypothetical protein